MAKEYRFIKCANCNGFGVIDQGYHNPLECEDCNGSGQVIRYESGAIAQYRGGPFLGQDTALDQEQDNG